MNKRLLYILILIGLVVAGFSACSDNIDPVVEELEFGRLMAPTNLQARVVNRNYARLSWNDVKDAESYTVEIYAGSLAFGEEPEGVPAWSQSNIPSEELPLADVMLQGETQYTARVQALSPTKNDSKWSAVVFKTDVEQSLNAILPDDLKATEVTLRWTAGLEVTHILYTPGDGNYVLTAEEKAAGAATLTGLTGSTEYTVLLKNGEKTRGTRTFTTLIDLGNATAIYPEDDIMEILTAAEEGDEFVIFPGVYTLGVDDGKFSVTKSLKLSGYLPNDKPVLMGYFEFGAAVSKLELNNITLDGTDGTAKLSSAFNMGSGSSVDSLVVNGCEIVHYKSQLIYNNSKATIGDMLVSNCIVRDITGDGGDGIDFRAGAVIRSFKAENTTFAEGFRTFLRMEVKCDIVFNNCTFYKIATFDNSNNHGLFRAGGAGSEFTVTNCLFVQTGVEAKPGTTMGNFCRQKSNMADADPTYNNNYYYSCYNLWVGLYTDPTAVKAKEGNPGFKDAASFDLTITNDIMKSDNVGDPRWLE